MKSRQYIVPTPDEMGFAFIEPQTVIRCEGKGMSTDIYYTDGKIVVCYKPLEYLEDFLQESAFVRINDNHLINILQISHYLDEGNERYVFMNDGTRIRISVNNRELIQKRIETL